MAPQITHCIFDMDGLLLDTEPLYTIVQQQILDRFGKTFTWELKQAQMGRKALEACEILVQELGIADNITAEQFLKEREDRLQLAFPTCKLMPGVDKLVRNLHASGVPMCVATSSHRAHFDLKTQEHKDLFSLFHHIVTGDQVTKGKPAPDIFIRAAELFDTPPSPSSCLVFEDALNGIEAAQAAGMSSVWVPDQRADKLAAPPTVEVLDSLEHFEPQNWGLPPFKQ